MPPFFRRFASAEREYRPIFLLGMGGVLFSIGNAVVWFVLPIIAESLFKNLFTVGLLIAVPSLIAMVFDIPVGGLSDHVGRKKFIIYGMVFMGLLGLVLPSVHTLLDYAIFMVFFGFANLMIIVPVRAYVMDIAPKAKSSEFFGIIEVAYQVGFAVGPVVAGYLIADSLDVSVSNTGLFYFLLCLASALIMLKVKESILLGKTLIASLKDAIHEDKVYLRSLTDFRDLHYSGAAILFTTFITVFIDGVIWTLEPLYTTLGLDVETVGIILVMFVIPFVLFEVPAGMAADRIGKVKMFILGMAVAGAFLIIFGSTKDPDILMISAFIATTGLALSRPAIDGFLTDISSDKERGGIVGVWNVSEDAAYVASPIIGGLIAESYSISSTFMLLGCILILSIPVTYIALKQSKIYEKHT
ncbi:MAG: MFS transporter [Candidatus Altiarchaeota archaeon]